MRIAFIADGRAENFRRWAAHFTQPGDEACVLSSAPAAALPGLRRLVVLPGLLRADPALVKSSDEQAAAAPAGALTACILRRRWDRFLFPAWRQLKTIELLPQARAARAILWDFAPEVTVAFRTQNEGYVAALADVHPWVLFTQGSDFVLMAERHILHRRLTSLAVSRADALLADCERDAAFARGYGLRPGCRAMVMPGNGGVDLRTFTPGPPTGQRERLVVCPRGLHSYLRTDVLLAAVAALSGEAMLSGTVFILLATPGTVGVLEEMVAARRLPPGMVRVLPFMSRPQLAGLLQRARAIVSPSFSDGTPNSMLEAMACGALPVMSDLASIREWIRPGANGLLFDPADPTALAAALRRALVDEALGEGAQAINRDLVREKADYERVMPACRDFLRSVQSHA